jgi:hypothetical protein
MLSSERLILLNIEHTVWFHFQRADENINRPSNLPIRFNRNEEIVFSQHLNSVFLLAFLDMWLFVK